MGEKTNSYVFISYAHRDESKIMPIITKLRNGGIRLWYDNGIEAGSEWPEYIADKILKCDRMICFVSNAYLDSQNCKRELNFAISEKKEILSVFTEEVSLTAGMKMQLGSYQSLFTSKHRNLEAFSEVLLRENFLKSCRIPNKFNRQHPAKNKTPEAAVSKQQQSKPQPASKTSNTTAASKPAQKREKNMKTPYLYFLFAFIFAAIAYGQIERIFSAPNSHTMYTFCQAMIFAVLLSLLNIFLIFCVTSSKAKNRRLAMSLFCIAVMIVANCLVCIYTALIPVAFIILSFLATLVANIIVEFILIIFMAITDA